MKPQEALEQQPNQLFCFLFFSSLSNEKKEENKQELKGIAAVLRRNQLISFIKLIENWFDWKEIEVDWRLSGAELLVGLFGWFAG